MAETKNLYQRLLDVTEEIGTIEKTGKNTMQNYAFIEQAQIVAVLRTQLKKHGVVIMPEVISRTLERHEVTRSSGKTGVDIHANVVSRFTVVNADNPDERFVCEWDAGEAIDSGDKATNKAVTASNKYFLMKLFNISDKEDPDAESPVAPPPTVNRTGDKSLNVSESPQRKRIRELCAELDISLSPDDKEEFHEICQDIIGKDEPRTAGEAEIIISVLETKLQDKQVGL